MAEIQLEKSYISVYLKNQTTDHRVSAILDFFLDGAKNKRAAPKLIEAALKRNQPTESAIRIGFEPTISLKIKERDTSYLLLSLTHLNLSNFH